MDGLNEQDVAEIMFELFDDVLSGAEPCEVLHDLHRQTVDSIADGNQTIKDKFFEYATARTMAEINFAHEDEDEDDLNDAIEQMRWIHTLHVNWPID